MVHNFTLRFRNVDERDREGDAELRRGLHFLHQGMNVSEQKRVFAIFFSGNHA
jgi:hypothetical protein